MERVQFQQEQMLAELKDLVEKGLFTQKEVKHIVQKRTAFETALVRRAPKKGDFLRYAAYEMGLEALRRKRVERLKHDKRPPSISDYALVRRQFHIFERALKKFKSDVGLWIQYIQVAKKEGARTLVGRITARALQLHPNVPALYILAASHELEHLSPSAARALLQRGIRLNTDSVEMWKEYVKMELGFVESLRRRWEVLGIGEEAKQKEKTADTEMSDHRNETVDNEGVEKTQFDADEYDESEAARKDIMEGFIVKSVISSAVKAQPKIELFTSIRDLLATYPCPPSLRENLVSHLFSLLQVTLPSDPAAIKLAATKSLTLDLEGRDLVEALTHANEQLANALRDNSEADERLSGVYARFVEEWCQRDIDNDLKGYLITSLQLLTQRKSASPSPSLLAANIMLLVSYQGALHTHLPPASDTPEKVLRLARKYTSKDKARTSAKVWLARLEAEKRFATSEAVQNAWSEARDAVEGDDIERVWLWGLDHTHASEIDQSECNDEPTAMRVQLLERIRDATAWGTVHEALLMRYAASTHAELLARLGLEADVAKTSTKASATSGTRERMEADEVAGAGKQRENPRMVRSPWLESATRPRLSHALTDARAARVHHIGVAYLPTARVWQEVFAQEAEAADKTIRWAGQDDSGRVLEKVFVLWRGKDGVSATFAWAKWLLDHGKGKASKDVVMGARSWLPPEDAREVERRWKKNMDDAAAESDA
ncbi:uncharacterized protein FIBRA_02092 [Fibroporia radiculosa]|uniref:U3 small nucleolar RNA-associated protein 6 N-terminal domain-containing protein n=1 Tax=Fibroporia radiculosa TaxID=599839 RepID=J4GMD0_9APHY|nr:uncharacterized protein FIBRA_02092 [Fibroporia radiculosa]CCM00065.1 predicted protein [Fibroporia radiculosa]